MTSVDKQWLLNDAMRLEDKEADRNKPLWLVNYGDGDPEKVLIVEALTAPGARAVMETLDLVPAGDPALYFGGPVAREAWPEKLWYRWLGKDDVREFFESLGVEV